MKLQQAQQDTFKYMRNLSARLTELQSAIRARTLAASRPPDSAQLLAVSKTQSADAVRDLFECGQVHFGENYLQEAEHKRRELQDVAITWHFIGGLQSNKTRAVAEQFDWVHTVDRAKLAERLGRQRPRELGPLNVCLQVNIDAESDKAGCAPADAPELAQLLAKQPGLRLRGLMAIPRADNGPEAFARLAALQAQLIGAGLDLDHLSMGMSADWPDAIDCGATWIRVGTALFGPRAPKSV